MHANWCLSDNVITDDNMQLIETPNQYFWSSKSADLWNWSLKHELTRSEIQTFVTQSSDPQISVDDCLQQLYSVLYNLADRACLKRSFNLILQKGSFPDAWRLSSLTVINKKVDKNVPINYRGIAASSILLKLFCLV